MLHDPISDFLTRIRNAKEQKHGYVDMPLSKAKESIAKVMLEQGFVKDVLTNKEKATLRVVLRYAKDRKPVVNGLKRISKPGLRRYIGHADIPRILGGLGIAILSTNKGIIEGEAARKEKLGGELLCYIW